MIYQGFPFQAAHMSQVRELLRKIYAGTGQPFYTVDLPNWERLCAMSKAIRDEQQIQLWSTSQGGGEDLLGIALYHPERGEFSCQALPGYSELMAIMVNWAEGEHRANCSPTKEQRPIKCTVGESNFAQRQLLTQRGYIELEAAVVFRRRWLDRPVPAFTLPANFQIQDLLQASDEAYLARVEIENLVFDRSLTADIFYRLQISPIYWPELELLMLAPNGRVVAFCSAWFDPDLEIAFFEPVGTLEGYRGRGLAGALLFEGLARLQALGARAVYLGNAASNTAANRLYEAAGMQIFDRESTWHKEF